MELNLIVKQVLLDIDFINRYETLSKEYSPEKLRNKTPLKYLDGELVMDMISEAGYIPGFDPKEKFFKFYQEIGDYTFGLHFILYNEGYSFGWFCIQKNSARTTENTLRYEVRGLRKILESTRQHLKCAITRSMTTRW
mgnify:CR=1 FL=1